MTVDFPLLDTSARRELGGLPKGVIAQTLSRNTIALGTNYSVSPRWEVTFYEKFSISVLLLTFFAKKVTKMLCLIKGTRFRFGLLSTLMTFGCPWPFRWKLSVFVKTG